jgi:hypothetical protein
MVIGKHGVDTVIISILWSQDTPIILEPDLAIYAL